MAMERQGFRAH